jgi:hypothetical protein
MTVRYYNKTWTCLMLASQLQTYFNFLLSVLHGANSELE